MDTRRIKAFLLIAKYRNFSKVAEEFSYTPSALSHIADSLEEELGVKLFNRTRKGVELTSAGEQLYDKFYAVVAAEDELFEAAAKLTDERESTLRVGAYSSVALHILPEILQSFKQAYPGIKTEIVVDDELQSWLDNNTADIVFVDDFIKFDNFYPLMQDEYVAVVPEGEFAGRDEIFIDELYPYSFIRQNEAYLDDYFDHARFHEIIPVKSIENDSIVYMVKEKIGVSVLPRLTMKNCPNGVRILKLKPKLARTIGIAFDFANLTLAGKRFVQHVKKML